MYNDITCSIDIKTADLRLIQPFLRVSRSFHMDNKIEIEPAKEKIVVFGFGAQGGAQALNLRDSGRNTEVFCRAKSSHIDEVNDHGLALHTDAGEAARASDIAAVLLPDKEQAAFYKDFLEPNLPKNAAIVFAHGFAVHYELIDPRSDLDIILVAPLGHANAVRSDFLAGRGVPCMVAVAQDGSGFARMRAHEYAKAISKTGPFIDTTFAEEVETDLFAEQALLCGGLPELVRATFDTLVNAGYNSDAAYFSCLKELRPIVNLIDEHSIAGMREKISDTAKFGAMTRGPRIIDSGTKSEMKQILSEIRSGKFVNEYLGKDSLAVANDTSDHDHPIEKIHRRYNPNLR